jgi:glycosyltransferase 2 family protein
VTRKRWAVAALWAAALALLAGVLRAVPLDDAWAALQQLRFWQIGVLAAANGLVLLALNGRWWFILRGQGLRIPFRALLGYRLAAFGLSYFTPGPHFGGEPLQVYLVEKLHGAPRPAAIAAMTLDKLLELLVNFTFLLGGVVVILRSRTLGRTLGVEEETAVFAALLAALPLLFLAATWADWRPVSRLLGWVWRRPLWRTRPLADELLERAYRTLHASEAAAAHFCRRAPLSLFLALLASLLSWAAMIGEFWLMVAFLGIPLTLTQLVVALTAARIAYLLLLPGGLGALEASQAFAFGALGLNPAVGISASLLIRARDVGLGLLGLWWGGRRLRFSRATATVGALIPGTTVEATPQPLDQGGSIS